MRQVKCFGETQWLNEHKAGNPVKNSGRVEKNFNMAIGHGSTSIMVDSFARLHRQAAETTQQATESPESE
jgi:hypothetical protein